MSDFWAGMAGQVASTAATNIGNFLFQQHNENREDNAVQRRAADMKAAGINPLLAAGNPAASAAKGQANVDLGIAENMMNAATMKQMKLQNEQITTETEGQRRDNELKTMEGIQMLQEIGERKRNIEWYKDNFMPSDRPQSWAQDIAQVLQYIRNGKIENIGTQLGKGAVDAVKAVGSGALEGVKDLANKSGLTEFGRNAWNYFNDRYNSWKDSVTPKQSNSTGRGGGKY